MTGGGHPRGLLLTTFSSERGKFKFTAQYHQQPVFLDLMEPTPSPAGSDAGFGLQWPPAEHIRHPFSEERISILASMVRGLMGKSR